MHLVGFIIRIYHEARSPKRQIHPGYYCYVIILCYFRTLFCQKSALNISVFHVSSPYRRKAKAQTFQSDVKDLRRFVAIWDNVLSKLKSIIMSRKKRRRNNGAENKRRENSESFHFRTSFGFSLISPFYTLFIF